MPISNAALARRRLVRVSPLFVYHPPSCIRLTKLYLKRCRAIFNLGIAQPSLDMPELLWKNYIDFEISESEPQKARDLYERLLQKTQHVKVYISFAQFEGTIGDDKDTVRKIFQRGYAELKREGLKEERVLLLDAWRVYEKNVGDALKLQEVEKMMPRRVKRRRMRADDNGTELGWEEFFDYHFPDEDDGNNSNLKILEMAAKWKKMQQEQKDEDTDEESSDEDSD